MTDSPRRVYEWPAVRIVDVPAVSKIMYVPCNFVEKFYQANWMSTRTLSIVQGRQKGDVGSMIR